MLTMDEQEQGQFLGQVIEPVILAREKNKARQLRRTNWWKRKRSFGICYYCQSHFSPQELTMDHIIPLAQGGRSKKVNLVPCCKQCNSQKKNKTPIQWQAYMEKLRKTSLGLVFIIAILFPFSLPSYAQSQNLNLNIEQIDKHLNYPNGLYSGNLSVHFQNKKKKLKQWKFHLYLKNHQRLYNFFNTSGHIIYRVLYYQPEGAELRILTWDPLREILHQKRHIARTKKILASGFNFIELNLYPYGFHYTRLVTDRPNSLNQENFTPPFSYGLSSVNEDFPDNLVNTKQKDSAILKLRPKDRSPFFKVVAHVKTQKQSFPILVGLDFYKRPGLLKRSLYPIYNTKLYNEELKKEQQLKAPITFRLLDFSTESLSIFELVSYDGRQVITSKRFKPDFIRL